MKSNLGITIHVHELNEKGAYEGGKYLIAPIFIDAKDISRATLYYYFIREAEIIADKLGLEKEKVEEVNENNNP